MTNDRGKYLSILLSKKDKIPKSEYTMGGKIVADYYLIFLCDFYNDFIIFFIISKMSLKENSLKHSRFN